MFLIKKYLFILIIFQLSLFGMDLYNSVQDIIQKEVPSQDVDSDGVLDYMDDCPDTFLHVRVNNRGCPSSALIVLLPNHKKNNAIFIENEMGNVEVDKNYNSVKMNSEDEPTEPKKMTKKEVDALFPFIEKNRYKKATRYTLYFSSTKLTRKSKIKLKTILRDINSRLNPIISVYGHTDTVGKKTTNYELSKKRAQKVKDIIDSKNIKYLQIVLRPMGEIDLKIKTKDEVSEPRNKRVEILIQ